MIFVAIRSNAPVTIFVAMPHIVFGINSASMHSANLSRSWAVKGAQNARIFVRILSVLTNCTNSVPGVGTAGCMPALGDGMSPPPDQCISEWMGRLNPPLGMPCRRRRSRVLRRVIRGDRNMIMEVGMSESKVSGTFPASFRYF